MAPSSSMLVGLSSLGSRAASGTSRATHAARVFRAAFASVTNNGDAAPVTGSEEDRSTGGRAAEKAADVGRNVKDAAAEAKDAGREVKDRAKEAGQDVKEAVKETH